MEWYKFGIAYALCVILPVWVLHIVQISLLYKVAFSIAGAAGVYWALEYGSLNLHKNR